MLGLRENINSGNIQPLLLIIESKGHEDFLALLRMYRVSLKNTRLLLEANNSSLEAAIGTFKTIFGFLNFFFQLALIN